MKTDQLVRIVENSMNIKMARGKFMTKVLFGWLDMGIFLTIVNGNDKLSKHNGGQ